MLAFMNASNGGEEVDARVMIPIIAGDAVATEPLIRLLLQHDELQRTQAMAAKKDRIQQVWEQLNKGAAQVRPMEEDPYRIAQHLNTSGIGMVAALRVLPLENCKYALHCADLAKNRWQCGVPSKWECLLPALEFLSQPSFRGMAHLVCKDHPTGNASNACIDAAKLTGKQLSEYIDKYKTFLTGYNARVKIKANALRIARAELEREYLTLQNEMRDQIAEASAEEEAAWFKWLADKGMVQAVRPVQDKRPDAEYYSRGTVKKVIEMTEDETWAADKVLKLVTELLDAHLKTRANVTKIYIGICISTESRLSTYHQHRTIFNHFEPLLKVTHDGFMAGEMIKTFENAGINAAIHLAPGACEEPFFNRARSAGGKKKQYSYTLYAQTCDDGKKEAEPLAARRALQVVDDDDDAADDADGAAADDEDDAADDADDDAADDAAAGADDPADDVPQEKARPKRARRPSVRSGRLGDRDSDEDEWSVKPKARAKPKEKAAASSSKSPG